MRPYRPATAGSSSSTIAASVAGSGAGGGVGAEGVGDHRRALGESVALENPDADGLEELIDETGEHVKQTMLNEAIKSGSSSIESS